MVTTAARKRGTHYLAVTNDFLLGGCAAVEKLFLAGEVSKDTIKLVIKELEKKAPEKVDSLKTWFSSIAGERADHIQPGEERIYKAQVTKDSKRAFIKLPLWDGAGKGDAIAVRLAGAGEPPGVTVRPHEDATAAE